MLSRPGGSGCHDLEAKRGGEACRTRGNRNGTRTKNKNKNEQENEGERDREQEREREGEEAFPFSQDSEE